MKALNKILFSATPSDSSFAVQQTLVDAIRFSGEIGFRSVLFKKSLGRPGHYAKLVSSWFSADVLVVTYPYFCRYCVRTNNTFHVADEALFGLLGRVRKRSRGILFVDDLPLDQALARGRASMVDSRSFALEEKILKCFDVLCVLNDRTCEIIARRYGIPKDRFVVHEIYDYGTTPNSPKRKRSSGDPFKIVTAGNGERGYSGDWITHVGPSDNITYEFIGPNWDWLSGLRRSDITQKVFKSTQELSDYMHSQADFGIIAYSDNMSRYFQHSFPAKFGAYVTAGVPILVLSNCTYVAH